MNCTFTKNIFTFYETTSIRILFQNELHYFLFFFSLIQFQYFEAKLDKLITVFRDTIFDRQHI